MLRYLLTPGLLVPLVAQQTAPPTYVAVVAGSDVHITGDMITAPDGLAAASGAKITSAKHNALLKLTRGGTIALCQNSILGIDARGSQLFMALQSGTVEASYPLSSAADNLLTADYRVSVISGSGMPGQVADYRVGIGSGGDVLIQVMPTSQSYLIVASNFDNAQAVVRPGEIRGFPALGSQATPDQIAHTVALRCPIENRQPQTSMAAATEEKVPADALQVPLAYRPPELPAMTPAPPPATNPAPPPAPAQSAALSSSAQPPPAAPPEVEDSPAPAASAPPPTQTEPAAPAKKTRNPISRFFRHLFGRKT